MKEWYKEPYFRHREWIRANASSLSLGTDELLVCLYIDFANEKGILIDQSILAEKLGLKVEKVNKALKSLVQKKKLVISLTDNRLQFDLEGLFKTDTEVETLTRVEALDADEHIMEVARMLSGKNLDAAAIENAKSLINQKHKQ